MPTYLGLDLGTHCGFALLTANRGGSSIMSGAWDCSIKTGHDSPSLRFDKFEKQLDDFLMLGVDRVYYEVVRRHRGTQAAHIYGAFLAKMQERCDRVGIPFEGLSVQEIKKFATGKGNASKEQVIEGVQKLGYDPGCDNEADAISIVLAGREKV